MKTVNNEEIGFAVSEHYGQLQITGNDRLDFLQRLSTNDFRNLKAPNGLPAVLASPVGRFIALLFASAREDALELRIEAEQAGALLKYFNSMIFWQDDVQVTNRTGEATAIELYGAGWLAHLRDLGFSATAEMPPYAWLDGRIGDVPVTLYRGGALDLFDWLVAAPDANLAEVEATFAALAPRLDAETLKQARIERGLPAWGHELTDDVTPLEVNLLPAVSFSKGCYVGQEVIARQTNYDKVTRRLVGLIFAADAPAELEGWEVKGPGRGGRITSSVVAPRSDAPIALAIVPRGLAEPDATVTVTHEDQTHAARVVVLPFA